MLATQTNLSMLLAKKRNINPFTTHANLIGMYMEDNTSFSGYLSKMVTYVYGLQRKEISVYDVDREMTKVVIYLAFKKGEKIPDVSPANYKTKHWTLLRELLLDNAYA